MEKVNRWMNIFSHALCLKSKKIGVQVKNIWDIFNLSVLVLRELCNLM